MNNKTSALFTFSILVFVSIILLDQATSTIAAPPPPISPTPTRLPPKPPATGQAPLAPLSPSNLAPEIEQARAKKAIDDVLQKYLQYWGPRYQVSPVEVTVQGEYAHGVAQWKSQTKALKDSIHVLARRSPNGTWQALMPSNDGLYLNWLDSMPGNLVSASIKTQILGQSTEADSLRLSKSAPALPAPAGPPLQINKEKAIATAQPIPRQLQPTVTPTPSIQQSTPGDAFSAVLNTYSKQAVTRGAWKLGEIRSDGSWAYAIAEEVDSTGKKAQDRFTVLLSHLEIGKGWYTVAPSVNTPQEYNALLKPFPDELMDEGTKAYLYQPELPRAVLNFGGHKLPWPTDQWGTVTQKDGSNHESQIDFDIPGDVYASKPGTVVFVKESSSSGSCNFNDWQKANIVVVQHADNEYSWYVHLAYNSVPVSVGNVIGFGTKVGVEDSTGYSCGSHLHYMASTGHTNWTDPTNPNAAPWGTGITAVDFAESSWSDLKAGQSYKSQNGGNSGCNNPSPNSDQIGLYEHANYCGSYKILGIGEYADPGAMGFANDSASSIKVGGNVKGILCRDNGYGGGCEEFTSDDSDLNNNSIGDNQVSSVKVQSRSGGGCADPGSDQVTLYVDQNYGGQCVVKNIGDYSNPSAIGLPNDSISSLKIGSNVKAVLCRDDNYGTCWEFSQTDSDLSNDPIGDNQVSSLRVMNKSGGGCTDPGSDQVTLYVDQNYSGQCVVKNIGDYSNPSAIGLPNDSISSLKIGSNVKAVLCRDDNYGTCWEFSQTDSDLSNDPIGDNQVSSLRVMLRVTPPSAPTLLSPSDNSTFNEGASIILSWTTTGDQYYGEIWDGPAGTQSFGWQNESSKNIGSQWAGYTYSWHVKAKNSAGESSWSSTWHFTVKPAAPSNLTVQTASCSQVNLYWTDNSGNEEGFKIYRNGSFVGQAWGTTNFQSTGLNENTNYSFYVTAYRGSIESDPSNTVNISTPSCVPPQPDLRSYAPSGYPYPVVPSSIPNTHAVNTLYAGQTTYFDWHFINSGNATASGNFYVELWVDGTRYVRYPYSNYGADWTGGFDDWAETITTPGWHTVKLITDPDNTIAESDETNNIWQGQFYWQPSAPYSDNMENGVNDWTATGLWHQVSSSSPYPAYHSLTHSWWYGQDSTGNYDTGSANSGDLTSPPIYVPSSGYYLRFWYIYLTETMSPNWDKRWMQISVDGGSFSNVLQLYDDPMSIWLQSPVIDMSGYAGHSVQVRFRFETIDGVLNNYRGWYIDDFGISTTPPPSCADTHEPNNTSAQATTIAYGQTLSGDICPGGDYDFYKFTGAASDKIVIDIDAKVNGSSLDPYIYLLDSNGTSVLAENDDEILYEVQDSKLGYQLSHGGTYYIKVKAWNHPSVGGTAYSYSIRLMTDNTNPATATIVLPVNDAWINPTTTTITATATDNQSGINRVEFLWHSADWQNSNWVWLGSDNDGRNGWSFNFDTSTLPDQRGGAFYIWAFDWANNWTGAGVWNLGIDRTAPTATAHTSLMYGGAQFRDFYVYWDGADNLSGIANYDVQYRDGSGGTWTDLLPGTISTYYRFVGLDGHTYYFRARARDSVGNQGNYASGDGDANRVVQVCAVSSDTYEADNTYGSARLIATDGTLQTHNIHTDGDQDWVKFSATVGNIYTLATTNPGGYADTMLYLYRTDGSTLLASNDDDPGNYPSSRIDWRPTTNGTYYAMVKHWDPYAYGCTTTYGLSITATDAPPFSQFFLPFIRKQ